MPNRTIYEPPPLDPIRPIRLSSRWFPRDRGFGLYAHPDRDEPTVVRIEQDELRERQHQWQTLLGEWFEQNGDAVAEEQARFDAARAAREVQVA